MTREICVVTGTRAEYGLLKPIMNAIQQHAGLQLRSVATGMHLSSRHGFTIHQIREDGFAVDAVVESIQAEDTGSGKRGRELARGITGLSDAFQLLAPDVVLVLGDRIEAFAAASACTLANRFLAHVHGGDRSMGGHDEPMRHAITRMAHLHFAASKESADRLLRMGEEPHRVHLVGAPGLDAILAAQWTPSDVVRGRLGLPTQGPLLVVVQHPVSTHPETAVAEMEQTLFALDALSLPTVLIHPNDDPGSELMRERIDAMGSKPWLVRVDNLQRTDYLGLLRSATALVGNSSSGIIEAPALGVAVVNVGDRQHDREVGGQIRTVPPDAGAIAACIRRALEEPGPLRPSIPSPFGDGNSSERIAQTLAAVELVPELLQKRLTF